MDVVNYRSLPNVPTCKELVDSCLSKTQRKTPTVIHKGLEINRIRKFYMRKVKYTQQNIHEKLTEVLESFPKIETIQPFYSDLLNVLYDKDHYKVALGKINITRGLIDRVSKEYVRLLKYGDSLYRCKSLKKIALGRMVTIIKKLDKHLKYLEQVRQHMSRLPAIDPDALTIVLCGFPNVGKSSFINSVSRAGVEVEPYAFTTKSLYVGQSDYKYIRFQVIDTPGILDHPLEERNTIEMQSITALAHLRSTILFIIDISETCGYSIEQQIQLLKGLQPLFENKCLFVALNKIDVVSLDHLSEENKQLLENLIDGGIQHGSMSTLTNIGVMEVRDRACELLLAQREQDFSKSNKIQSIANRLYVAIPKPRDNKVRTPCIPQKLVEDIKKGSISLKTPTQKELKNKDEPNYKFDPRDLYLIDEDEKYDIIPEIYNGKNISDFIDRDISFKLHSLQKEEELRDRAGYYHLNPWSYKDIKAHMDRENINLLRQSTMSEHASKRTGKPPLSRQMALKSKEFFENPPVTTDEIIDIPDSEITIPIDPYSEKLKSSGVQGNIHLKSKKLIMRSKIKNNLSARAGDADRRVYSLKPKHLFSGKRKAGKTQRR